MDENSDPQGAKIKRERFWVVFCCFLKKKKKTCKDPGEGTGGVIGIPSDTYQQIESQQTEPAADRLATQGEIRSSPASF